MRTNRKKRLLVVIIAVLCLAILCGCNTAEASGSTKSIVSVEKISQVNNVDTYAITFSDGSVYNFSVTNGKDGEGLDIAQIYEDYIAHYPGATYEDFVKALTANVNFNTVNIDKALLSSLKIYSEFTEQVSIQSGSPFHPSTSYYNETAIYCGSAVIYSIQDDYTYLITNYHVLFDADAVTESKIAKKITCYLYGSEGEPSATSQKDSDDCTIYDYGQYGIACEYVGGSIVADLAVVKVETDAIKAINNDIKEISFADEYNVGQTAIAIGNSENEGISITGGIVSVDNEYISYAIDSTTRYYRSLRIDTAIYQGNSGGGLFNSNGELIGITNAGDGTAQNINYAIPLSIVKSVVENIMTYQDGTVKKVTLGVSCSTKNSKYVYDESVGRGRIVETVLVESVTENSIAARIGLSQGDVILKLIVNGEEYSVGRSFEISDILYSVRTNDTFSVVYERNGVTVTSTEYMIASGDLKVVE